MHHALLLEKLVATAAPESLQGRLLGGTVGSPWLVTFANPHSYQVLRTHPELVSRFDAVYPDGSSLALLASLIAGRRVPRCSFDMTSLAGPVFETCSRAGIRVAIVGSTPDALHDFLALLRERYPRLLVVHARDGYIRREGEMDRALAAVASARPEVLVCGMGTPLQERFLVDAARCVPTLRVGFTCGGFIHQTTRRLEYYPRVVDRLQLRWAWRFLREPHVRDRLLKSYPRFVPAFVRDARVRAFVASG